jgi:hypothetical protein
VLAGRSLPDPPAGDSNGPSQSAGNPTPGHLNDKAQVRSIRALDWS